MAVRAGSTLWSLSAWSRSMTLAQQSRTFGKAFACPRRHLYGQEHKLIGTVASAALGGRSVASVSQARSDRNGVRRSTRGLPRFDSPAAWWMAGRSLVHCPGGGLHLEG